MEPRPFVRVAVCGLALRIPVSSKASRGGVHAAASPCTCEISLPNFPKETVPISLVAPTTAKVPDANNTAASFYLDEPALEKLLLPSWMRRKSPCLKVTVYLGKQKLGTFRLPVGLDWAEGKPAVLYSGWTCIGDAKADEGKPGAGAELHVEVKVEADPRYMFQFEKVTALSPQIIQVSSKNKQSIFSCKFSRDKLSRCRVGAHDISSSSASLEGREKRKERKGWLVMVHDLSGSPVAAASMVTPFVPSAGSDCVARSNPGAWLILRPDSPGTWRPWGRLEAWREKNGKGVGSRFQLSSEGGAMTGVGSGVLSSETLFSAKKGGEFTIDVRKFKQEGVSPVESPRRSTPCPSPSPSPSPRSSGELSFNLGLQGVGEFVMSCGVRGDRDSSKPLVQVAMRHVSCVEDVAVFIALAAAVDLSVDACQPFRRRLRKELGEVLSSSS